MPCVKLLRVDPQPQGRIGNKVDLFPVWHCIPPDMQRIGVINCGHFPVVRRLESYPFDLLLGDILYCRSIQERSAVSLSNEFALQSTQTDYK